MPSQLVLLVDRSAHACLLVVFLNISLRQRGRRFGHYIFLDPFITPKDVLEWALLLYLVVVFMVGGVIHAAVGVVSHWAIIDMPKRRVTRRIGRSLQFSSAVANRSVWGVVQGLVFVWLLFVYWLVLVLGGSGTVVGIYRQLLNWNWRWRLLLAVFVDLFYSVVNKLSVLFQIKFFVVTNWWVNHSGRL